MAEQFPEEGGKTPRLGLKDGKQKWAPGPLPGSFRRDAKEPAPPPSFPRQDWSEFGDLPFPPPQTQDHIPLALHSPQSLLSFPSGTPVFLVNAPAVPLPPSAKPPSPATAPDSHLPLGTLSIHSWHRRCHSAPRCPQPWPKAAWDPCPGVPQRWHPGALVLGTRGCL